MRARPTERASWRKPTTPREDPLHPSSTRARVLLCLPLASPLSAATATWTGNGPSPNWDQSILSGFPPRDFYPNWSPNTAVPAPTDDVVFATGFGSGATVSLAFQPRTVNSLTINTASVFQIGGAGATDPLTITSGAITRNDLAATEPTQTIAAPLVLGANATWTLNGSNGLVVAGAVSDNNAARSITKLGPATLTLSPATPSTFGGPFTVSAGALVIDKPTSLGLTSAGTLIASNTTLTLRGDTTFAAEPLTLQPNTTLRNLSGNNVWTGPVTFDAAGAYTFTADAGTTLTFSAPLTAPTDADLTLKGGGTFVLKSASPGFSGPIHLTAGTLRIGAGGFSPADTLQLSRQLTLSAGTTLDVTNTDFRFDLTAPQNVAATLLASLTAAYNKGRWTGVGLTSSTAAGDTTRATTLAYAQSADTLRVRYTWQGDLNLDGLVDAADRALLNLALQSPGGTHTWSTADLNYDGKLTPDDLALFSLGAAISANRNIVSIPEPTSHFACVYATSTALSLIRRRDRRP